MKRFVPAALVLLAVGSSLAAMLVTQDQARTCGVLTELKLESVPPKQPGIVGGPQHYKVTKATLEHLEKLMKDGKIVEVDGDGSIKMK